MFKSCEVDKRRNKRYVIVEVTGIMGIIIVNLPIVILILTAQMQCAAQGRVHV